MSGMCDATNSTSDRSVMVSVFQPGKCTVFQSKFKAVAAIKGFTEALEPGFESRLPDKKNEILSDSDEDKEETKKNQECSCRPFYDSVL